MRPILTGILSLILLTGVSCVSNFEEPQIDLSAYELTPGLVLQNIASEPLIEAPVALNFDSQGNIWVLEMSGYMRTLEGVDEEDPIGRILVLEDKDRDGVADHSKVFLDSLKLARAFTHVYGGLLYAEPPYLYFTEITEDLLPGKTEIVDSAYAVGGNVEHQPNGLLMNIDNWIYSAKDSKRYRKQKGKWIKESTSFRGQWGITHDPYGRLYYNDNSNQLRGDYVLPNLVNKNPRYEVQYSIGNNVVANQAVYPLQATAVNRGYIPGVLREDGMLNNFTSAAAPLYFEGSGLPEAFSGDFFVCGPEVNLVKRNRVGFDSLQTSGEQVWKDREFLRSWDQAFRPVNLANGPDGALFLVDMHRGIIQHKTYLTSYLREQYISRGLDTVSGMGRILRISSDSLPYRRVDLTSLSAVALLDSLASANIWIRDNAQQLLITKINAGSTEKGLSESGVETTARLQDIVNTAGSEKTRIHALYSLEGIDQLRLEKLDLKGLAEYPHYTSHILKLMAERDFKLSVGALETLLHARNEIIDYYLVHYLARTLAKNGTGTEDSYLNYLTALLNRHAETPIYEDALFSALYPNEKQFFLNHEKALSEGLSQRLDSISQLQIPEKINFSVGEDPLTRGRILFNTHCATCHGPDGKGIQNLAPPLLQSEFVSESKERLVALMLYGLHGPITVNGTAYDFQVAMPGIGNNKELTDENIRDIGNFVRNAFTTSPQSIRTTTIDSLRKIDRTYDQTFTADQLHDLFDSN
ncbi:Cytochrome C oxidase, cbb3-type, subunit III [Robiginitalea myxolifaciens]|uniref:Cytochrome C oxidase, cbb3-type, subunit III n=1 Tax=Robiginitalea myxolifaciens TaxID=400055 RepID=A0A1I6H1B1_9FLAO|nr:c-type cytochrome [Robiginitalea myxolifaciens]SFR48255.1 Cytochrome C oxidase, cbb3-type, subunit III [Robiginitalea myxolifaciens]